jgi:hypothetical protein
MTTNSPNSVNLFACITQSFEGANGTYCSNDFVLSDVQSEGEVVVMLNRKQSQENFVDLEKIVGFGKIDAILPAEVDLRSVLARVKAIEEDNLLKSNQIFDLREMVVQQDNEIFDLRAMAEQQDGDMAILYDKTDLLEEVIKDRDHNITFINNRVKKLKSELLTFHFQDKLVAANTFFNEKLSMNDVDAEEDENFAVTDFFEMQKLHRQKFKEKQRIEAIEMDNEINFVNSQINQFSANSHHETSSATRIAQDITALKTLQIRLERLKQKRTRTTQFSQTITVIEAPVPGETVIGAPLPVETVIGAPLPVETVIGATLPVVITLVVETPPPVASTNSGRPSKKLKLNT